jgi:hypothetical protein
LRPEAPPADATAFQQHHLQAALGGMQCRRQAGAAAADHDEVGIDLAGERRVMRRRTGRRRIVGSLHIKSGVEAHDHALAKR